MMKQIVILSSLQLVLASQAQVQDRTPDRTQDRNQISSEIKAAPLRVADLVAQEVRSLKEQSQVLDQMRSQIEKNSIERKAHLESDIQDLEKKVIQIVADNEKQNEENLALQKDIRSKDGSKNAVQTLVHKAEKNILDYETDLARLGVKPRSQSSDASAGAVETSLEGLIELSKRAEDLLAAATQTQSREVALRDEKGELRMAEVRFFGRGMAYASDSEKVQVVAPSGDGTLKILETLSDDVSKAPAYLFGSLLEKAQIKKKPTWIDQLADLGPGLLMGVLATLVMGLFVSLAKE